MKCVLIFVCDRVAPVGEGVWSMYNTMKTGAWLSSVAGQMLTGSDLSTKHVHCR